MTDTPTSSAAPQPRSTDDDDPVVASLLQRFSARALDTGIAAMLGVAAASVHFAIFAHGHRLSGTVEVGLEFTLPWLVYFLYEGALLAHDGQTLGKKAVGIRVASYADGSPPGKAGWARAAVYILPGAFFCLGYLFWLLNALSCTWDRPYRQCLHDKSAKTVVVTS
jgi:uncharacterized RDD family membrane protein YckC